MTTQDFIAQLQDASGEPLVFVNLGRDTIHTGYHLTEIKAAKFDTVDWVERRTWNETIM